MQENKTSDHSLSFEYNQITDEIFIGTNMCCAAHFKKELLAKGITADISVEGEKVDAPFGVEFFSWIPVRDHTPPTRDQMHLGTSVLDKLVKMKKKIYVHCQHGHGRAPTLVAAYFINCGMSTDEALSFIKSKRPSIHLDETQVDTLREFEKFVVGTLYKCEECGLKYRDKEWAKKCMAWCGENKSCNLEIISHAEGVEE